ncbi:MAG: trypsin-like serine protease, partial [Myxococcales bacterium]|nr:trypsin-like serine protease [Myxococcales bacterium]
MVRSWRSSHCVRWLVALSLLVAVETAALVLAEGPAGRNRNRPHPELGWAGACTRGGLSAVHLGDGWILTAAHVGLGSVRIGDEDFPPIPGSEVDFAGTSHRLPDLALFRVAGTPAGPRLRIASLPPRSGERVVLMGAGGVRGERFTWRGLSGFKRAPSQGLQWGENRVAKESHRLVLGRYNTDAFAVEFDDFYRLPQEAIASEGDSGGPVFRIGARGAELLGILIATSR